MEGEMVKYEVNQRIEVVGAEVLDRSDIILPRVRLRQPTSKFGTPQNAGQFHNNLTETFVEQIEAVPLRVAKGRVMWPAAYSGDNAPECASDDGTQPRANGGLTNRQPGPCAVCPMSQWGENGVPPRCSLVYTYLFADRNDDMPFLLSAMRTSAKAAKKLNSLIKMFGIRKTIIVRSELVNNEQGQWYEFVFQAGQPLTPDEVKHYGEMAASLAGVAMVVDTEVGTEATADFIDEPLGF